LALLAEVTQGDAEHRTAYKAQVFAGFEHRSQVLQSLFPAFLDLNQALGPGVSSPDPGML
jgi:hypothetical protein